MKRLEVILIVLILLTSGGCTAVKLARKFKSGVPELPVVADTVHFEKEHPIVLNVSINNLPDTFRFILDTGAPTMISPGLASKLGIRKGKPLPSKGAKISAYIARGDVTIRVDKAEVRNFIPLISEFPEEEAGVSGFIGSDFLRFFKVQLNYGAKTLVFARPEYNFRLSRKAIRVKMKTSFPLYFPIFTCQIDTIQARAMVDVGSPFSIVMPLKFKDRLVDVVKSRGVMAPWPTKKSLPNYLGRVRSFKIGNFEVKNALVLVAYLPMPYVLIGKDFLKNFVTVLDYHGKEIVFDPSDKVKIKTNEFSYGLRLHREGRKVVVQGVWEGSPADKAGLDPGDEVLELNHRPAESLKSSEIADFIENTDSLEMVILKPKMRKKYAIILKKDWILP